MRRAGARIYVLLSFFLLISLYYCTSKPRHMETRASIKGILQDQSGKAIEDAVVMIVNGSHDFTDIASVSNEKGEFYISNIVVPGKYILQIQSTQGMRKKEVDIKNKDTVLNLTF